MIIADFGITLCHYASHRFEWLWLFHAPHHSVIRMYGFNGLIKHPVHQTLETIAGTAPLLLLGMPVEVGMLLGFAITIQLLLQHSNADMRLGPLRYVLALVAAASLPPSEVGRHRGRQLRPVHQSLGLHARHGGLQAVQALLER